MQETDLYKEENGSKLDKNSKSTIVTCLNCLETFKKKRKHQKFCSQKCRKENWEKNNPRLSILELQRLIKEKGDV